MSLIRAMGRIDRGGCTGGHGAACAAVFLAILAACFTTGVTGCDAKEEYAELIGGSTEAGEQAAALSLVEEAERTFDEGNRHMAAGTPGAEEKYTQAAALYGRAVSEYGITNGAIFYNIGNAYYLAGDLGRAVLYYLRAQLYAPGDRNIEANLRVARSKRGVVAEETNVDRVIDILLFWHFDIPLKYRTLAVAILLAVFWVAMILFRFVRRPGVRRIALWALVPALVLATSVAVDMIARTRPRGVVIVPEVECRKGDSLSYAPAFQQPLTAGAEFRVLERRSGWLRVKPAEAGDECWLPGWTVELVGDNPESQRE